MQHLCPPDRLSRILWSSNQENFAPVTACLMVIVSPVSSYFFTKQLSGAAFKRQCSGFVVQACGLSCRPISTLLRGAQNSRDDVGVVCEGMILWQICFKMEILTCILFQSHFRPGQTSFMCSNGTLNTLRLHSWP